jgi:putative tricarboxylic transport membrane protein
MRLDKIRADLVTAPALFALGLAALVGGWRMDRLEIRRIHPASIPGLTPMLLGAALMLCAALLYADARGRARAGAVEPPDGAGSASALLAAGGLCLFYALVLVGWLPFGLATGLFVAAFAGLFGWAPEASAGRNLRWAGLCAGFGALVALGVSALFRDAFLVRLP